MLILNPVALMTYDNKTSTNASSIQLGLHAPHKSAFIYHTAIMKLCTLGPYGSEAQFGNNHTSLIISQR